MLNPRTSESCLSIRKITSENVKMRSKCDDLVKITSKNVKMRSKCDDLMKITSKNVTHARRGLFMREGGIPNDHTWP